MNHVPSNCDDHTSVDDWREIDKALDEAASPRRGCGGNGSEVVPAALRSP
jgi:hypothetical protein